MEILIWRITWKITRPPLQRLEPASNTSTARPTTPRCRFREGSSLTALERVLPPRRVTVGGADGKEPLIELLANDDEEGEKEDDERRDESKRWGGRVVGWWADHAKSFPTWSAIDAPKP